MNTEDVTLQELIVRALTGRDESARLSLESVTAGDPQLRQFMSELEGIVESLAESKEWRSSPPSAALTAKVRQAVVSRLPAAPPHFRTVVLEADLGRKRAARKVILMLAVAAILLGATFFLLTKRSQESGVFRLNGKVAYEAPLKGEPLSAWEPALETQWQSIPEGLQSSGSEEAGAIFLKQGFDATSALAFNLDVRVPDFDERSSAMIYLADARGSSGRPLADGTARPVDGVALELTNDGLVLSGPGNALLHSRPLPPAAARFYRVRMEYLGRQVRLIVNGEVIFEGALLKSFQGPLHAGVRVGGLQKNKILFNALRIER